MDSIIIINNVRNYIKEKGLKQKFVAEKAGFTEQEFSNILNGRKIFEINYVPSVCNALGVTPNELFSINVNERKI